MKKIILVLPLLLAGCASSEFRDDESSDFVQPATSTATTIQLGWKHSPRFIGFYAAQEKGWYRRDGLNVKLLSGGKAITAERSVVMGQAQFGVDRLPEIVVSRDSNSPVVSIAQIFQRSGALVEMRKTAELRSLQNLKGHGFGMRQGDSATEFSLAFAKNGLQLGANVALISIQDSTDPLSGGNLDAASMQTYDWISSPKPPDDILISLEKSNLALPQDAIFTTDGQLDNSDGRDVALKLVRQSLRGYIFCRDNVPECADFAMKYIQGVPKDRMEKMIAEVNLLIWPSPKGIGWTDGKNFKDMTDALYRDKILVKPADKEVYTNKYANEAQIYLRSSDVIGERKHAARK